MKLLPTPAWRVFLVVFAVGLTWAAVTGQEWEDFYITYRASKNLAEGHGLVFTEGHRVHSFTSPLGVLLPAASYLLTGRTSDVAALWIFRLLSLAALGGAAAVMWQTIRRLHPATAAPALLLVALVATDSKTLAFSTSGMETAFLLLFIAWALWAVFVRPARFSLHLGLAWAGLMWTRPDSCVYVAGFGAGLLLFAPGEGGYLRSRASWLKHVLLAGAVCTVVYLPWFAWAWSYYGTPVPHTITAKGLFNEFSASGLARSIVEYPLTVLAGKSSLTATFMPYYGGVPAGFGWAPPVSFAVALIPLVLFLLPGVRWEVRLASFVYATGQVYLTSVLRFPAPWYIPQAAFLGIVALALALGQLLALAARWRETPGGTKRAAGRWLPRLAGVLGLAVVAAMSALSVAMARQACLEMTIIERDTRAAIGRWLRAEAKSPRESVFLEPLGFIGYFSGLKMLDYPGLCSPEVVEARRRATNRSYPYCWSELILSLRPDWLVLRPFELGEINGRDPLVLGELYERVKVFDSTDAINRARFVPLKGYLEYNGVFEIYRLRQRSAMRPRPFQPILMPVTLEQLAVRESPMPVEPAGNSIKAHAPSRLVLPVPAGASLFLGGLGIYEGAYAKPRPEATDGAEFRVEHVAITGERTVLLQRMLDPSAVAGDRGLQQFDLDLPASGGRIELTITAGPHGSNAYDWSYWYDLRFGIAP